MGSSLSKTHLGRTLGAACGALVATLGYAMGAAADEPRKVTEPMVLSEPAEITNVVDAFDGEDPFDLHLSLGFQQSWKRGDIRRETHANLPEFSSGGYTADNVNVARYAENTSRLNTRADIGIFKDLALVLRMPIILSNSRNLESLDGSGNVEGLTLQGAPGEGALFSLPFESPDRSGIEYLAVGLDFGIFNQSRDYTKPTWVFGLEGRFNVSEPLHACNANAPSGRVECPYPGDVDQDGRAGENDNEAQNFRGGRDPGVSRGTTGLQLHTYISKRTKYIEPYMGFEALFEFQNDNSDFGTSSLKGSLVNHPPFQGTMIGGMAITPWEIRDQFQKLEFDFRLKGTYRSEGRDYSPLFDALGTTSAPSMRRPNYARFEAGPGNTSVADTSSEKIYFTGITDVQQHGIYTVSTQVTFQAGAYVKFTLGGAFTAEQGHVITFDQPCNPDFSNDVAASGPCRTSSAGGRQAVATGIPNPNYRPQIDVPGRRFRYDGGTIFDAWLNATVMF